MRIYHAVRENLPLFHEFFRVCLLPVQLRHGARLAGRWETEDGRVIAIWEYDDRAAYERIDAAVRADPDSRHAQERRAQLPALMTSTEEVFMSPAGPAAPARDGSRSGHAESVRARTAARRLRLPDPGHGFVECTPDQERIDAAVNTYRRHVEPTGDELGRLEAVTYIRTLHLACFGCQRLTCHASTNHALRPVPGYMALIHLPGLPSAGRH
jgi:hypothetical protein